MTEPTEEEMMNDLLVRTRNLPREIDPPVDAWSAIRAGMERPDDTTVTLKRDTPVLQRPIFLAAASLVLVAASSLITIATIRNREQIRTPAVVATSSRLSNRETSPATFAEFAAVENDYINSANQLSAILDGEGGSLSPETVAKLRSSLRIIDGAILEARRALAADPANRALVDMLNTSYNQKLDLLRRTTEMGRS